MTFAAIDERFHSDPKIHSAGNDGAGVYARALSYSADYSTDGFIPHGWAAGVAKPALRKKITAARLWLEVAAGDTFDYIAEAGTPSGLCRKRDENASVSYTVSIPERGYFIPDYLEYNPTRADVVARREDLSRKRSEAGRKGAFARWHTDSNAHGKTAVSHEVANGKPMANAWQPDGLPSPTPTPGALAPSPALSAAEQTGHESHDPGQEHEHLTAFAQLHNAVGATDDALAKLRRAARGCPEGDLIAAREAATGPGVNDKLAVALATLKKRKQARTDEPPLTPRQHAVTGEPPLG